jgi:colicin import membrane protein
MMDFVPAENRAVIVSFAIHGVLLVMLSSNLNFTSEEITPRLAIQATLIDPDSLRKTPPAAPEPIAEPEPVVEPEPEPVPVEPQVDEQKLHEQQRLDEKRQIQLQKDRAVAAERKAVEDRKAAEQRQAVETERKNRARREAELLAAMVAEEEQAAAVNAGDAAEWGALIRQKTERYWVKSPSAPAGLKCEVIVSQLPTGDVVDVRIGQCNGDGAVQRSVENAVRRASPLPLPENPAVFQRNLRFVFEPEQ